MGVLPCYWNGGGGVRKLHSHLVYVKPSGFTITVPPADETPTNSKIHKQKGFIMISISVVVMIITLGVAQFTKFYDQRLRSCIPTNF